MIRRALLPAFILAFALSQAAIAAPACQLPKDLTPVPVEAVPPDQVARVSTVFYILTVSWAPEWCRTNGQGITGQHLQCDGPDRGFFLHGLWPNGNGKPYPRYCTPVGRLDAATVRRMFCRTPSAELLQHEWQAHGGCGWTDPKAFFRHGAALYDAIVRPKIETIPADKLTAGAVRQAFIAVNPAVKADQIMVADDKEGRFSEVRLCYDLAFHHAACPGGVFPADGTPLTLTPSRTHGF